jgi:hypothetical protein
VSAGADARTSSAVALLLALASLLVLASGVSYYLLQSRSGTVVPVVPAATLYSLAIDSAGAAAGDGGALARFQQSQKALEDAAARDAGAPYASDARFTRLMGNATALLKARAPLADAVSAAHDIAGLVPRLAAEASALAAGLPPGTASAAAVLERFAARAERLQLDVSALRRRRRRTSPRAASISDRSSRASQAAIPRWHCRT